MKKQILKNQVAIMEALGVILRGSILSGYESHQLKTLSKESETLLQEQDKKKEELKRMHEIRVPDYDRKLCMRQNASGSKNEPSKVDTNKRTRTVNIAVITNSYELFASFNDSCRSPGITFKMVYELEHMVDEIFYGYVIGPGYVNMERDKIEKITEYLQGIILHQIY